MKKLLENSTLPERVRVKLNKLAHLDHPNRVPPGKGSPKATGRIEGDPSQRGVLAANHRLKSIRR
jgi:hypothetical protein